MKQYGEMTMVSAKWLHMLPIHWECKKIGSLFYERKIKVSDRDYAPLSVAKMGVVPQLATAVKTDAGDNRKLVCIGDFVINSRSDRKGSCGVADRDGSVSLINIVLTPRNEWNNRYVHYLMRSQPFSEEYYRYGRGIVSDLWTTRFSEMKNILLPVPPHDEQDQIVRFLDWKVSEINRLINIKHTEIERLEELKKVVVSRTVASGLNSHVKMKDSGVNWIGNTPEHWKIMKAKRFVKISNGSNPETDGDIPVYGSGTKFFKTCGEFKEGPAVLLGRKGSIKNPQYIEKKYWNVDTAFDVKPLNNNINLKYYWYISQVFDYDFYTTQTAIPSMTQTNYENMYIPIPTIDEQNQIVAYLDEQVPKIESAIVNKQEQIEKLQELKSRLISDVVTGKIDVRDIEIPEYEFVDEEVDYDPDSEDDTEYTEEQED